MNVLDVENYSHYQQDMLCDEYGAASKNFVTRRLHSILHCLDVTESDSSKSKAVNVEG